MKENGVLLLVAGGAGVIGSNFIRYILASHDDWQGGNGGKLTYGGDLAHPAAPRLVRISTDGVYGSLGATGKFSEDSPLRPNSPYAASKTAADLLVRAYFKTYGLPAIVTRCSNNYGPYQFPEKIIPFFVTLLKQDKQVQVYGDGMNVRDWIHVDDHSRAGGAVLLGGKPGEVYNVGGGNERTNIEITKLLLAAMGQAEAAAGVAPSRAGAHPPGH